ncbi:MAG: DNA polymerase III subunit gamma/tau [Endomicrobium sp.]|jgi:DNA polymerase-3 subunit gamma/tau|nr:DNA polymerase III subunit gamma/tau [Endomicrobium sp.]
MSYLVLARKFRPQTFDDVIGQEHILQTLKNAISQDRIAHAYLFSGPRGCGKTTMARILAKALNCKNRTFTEPCGECQNCIEISKSSSVDVLEIDGASNNGIDEIRTLRENVKFASANSKYKIYIIDEAHQITTQAFNALLKTLEEPPEHVVFILATTEQHKIPVTILSRCQKYRFKLIPPEQMIKSIKTIAQKENFQIDDDALNIVTTASGGSMRDALSLLDQAISSCSGKITGEYIRDLLGLLPKDIIASVTESIAKGQVQSILKAVKEIIEQGYNILQFARDLRNHLRQVMIYSINTEVSEISSEDKKLFEVQKSLFSISCHVRMSNLLSRALDEMRWSDDPRMVLEMYLLKMAEPYYNIGELIDKINDLEKSIQANCTNANYSIKGKSIANKESVDDVTSSADLISVWTEIVDEMVKKHPLTAQSLKKTFIKVLGNSSIQLSTARQFDYESLLEFKEQISKLFKRKTGFEVLIKIVIEKDEQAYILEKEDIVITQESSSPIREYVVKEDFQETSKTAIPKHIEEIAKKFGSIAKKV